MSKQRFSLTPFPSVNPLPDVKVTGEISRYQNTFSILYALIGPVSDLVIPAADKPVRKKSLWEETCLEFFLGIKKSPQYLECNLSPAGHWNIYRFRDYRNEMQEEGTITSLPFSMRNHPEGLQLFVSLKLDMIVPEEQALEVGISAVLKHINGMTSYWALTHPGPRPDFHRRDSFIIDL